MSELHSFMSQLGATLIDRGYAVLPIRPGVKSPGQFISGEWREYPSWQKHCDRPSKPFEVDIWRRWPGCAVGVACGNVCALDIDVLDAEMAHKLQTLAFEMLGETPAVRIGQAPKRLLLYRTKTPFPGRKRHPLEVLCHGQQFLAYAIHPVTGRPYEWPIEGLEEIDRAKLPEITEAQALAWLEAAYRMVPPEMRPATLAESAERRSEWAGPSDPRGTYEAVKSALEYVPNDDVSGTDWVTMGMAIKAALGEEGKPLWLDWSSSSAKSGMSGKPNTAEKRWKGFKPRSIGAGSIYYMAEQRGWTPAPDLILNGEEADRRAAPDASVWDQAAAGFIQAQSAKARDRRLEQAKVPLPVESGLLDVDGVLKLLVDECGRTAIRPQPFLALGAAIAAVATLAGRQYRNPTDLRTNIYIAGVAESGGGKDHAPEVIRRAFEEAGLDRFLGGETIASGRAILTSLEGHPVRLFQVDEFGLFLQGVAGKKAAPHRAEIWSELMKLYSRAKGVYRGTEYANKRENPRVDIHQPCVCFHGTTTPSTLWAALESGALTDGSLARFLIFITDNNRPARNRSPAIFHASPELVAALQAVARGPHAVPAPGNIPGVALTHMLPGVALEPYDVPYGPGAAEAHDKHLDDEDSWAAMVEGTPQAAIVNRFAENAAKFALIRAISRDPVAPVIGVQDVEWAWSLSQHCIRTLLREAERFIADNEHDAKHKKVLHLIRKAGPAGLTRAELYHKTHFLGDRREAVFSALVEGGQVTMKKTPGKTKPTISYHYVDEIHNLPCDNTISGLMH